MVTWWLLTPYKPLFSPPVPTPMEHPGLKWTAVLNGPYKCQDFLTCCIFNQLVERLLLNLPSILMQCSRGRLLNWMHIRFIPLQPSTPPRPTPGAVGVGLCEAHQRCFVDRWRRRRRRRSPPENQKGKDILPLPVCLRCAAFVRCLETWRHLSQRGPFWCRRRLLATPTPTRTLECASQHMIGHIKSLLRISCGAVMPWRDATPLGVAAELSDLSSETASGIKTNSVPRRREKRWIRHDIFRLRQKPSNCERYHSICFLDQRLRAH